MTSNITEITNLGSSDKFDDDGLNAVFNIEEALQNSRSVDNLKQDFFLIELLEKCTHTPKAFGTKFEKWVIVSREDVYVGQNDKSTQTRAGTQLFLNSVNQISKSVETDGWDYSLPQPTIALYEKVAPDGKYYKYQLINGRHRWYAIHEYAQFPAGLISAESAYRLRSAGTILNNEDPKFKKRDNTPDDVKLMIHEGIECGEIESNKESIIVELRINYPFTKTKHRPQFAQQILKEIGIKSKFEDWDESSVKRYLKEQFSEGEYTIRGVQDSKGRIGFMIPFGREKNEVWGYHLLKKSQKDNPNIEHYIIGYLSSGEGVTIQPTSDNIQELRDSKGNYLTKSINNDRYFVNIKQKGEFKEPQILWLPQDNVGGEQEGQWQ